MNMVPTINNREGSWGNREFYSIKEKNNEISIKVRTLNIFKRILRYLFGAYDRTIITQTKLEDFVSKYYDDDYQQVEKIKSLIARLRLFNKNFNIAVPSPMNEVRKELTKSMDILHNTYPE